MTHEPEQISIARQAWVEEVSKMTPAEKDGAIQGVIDAGYALGLVVVPRERIEYCTARFEDAETVLIAVPLVEYKARQTLQAAQRLAQLLFDAGAVEILERRFAGQREVRYRLTFVKPVETVETAKPGLLSGADPATT